METALPWLIFIWLAILPGLLFVWGFEQQVGRLTTSIGGGLLRSIGYSAVFHLIFMPLTYHLWSTQWDMIREGNRISLLIWAAMAVYVLIPISMGWLVGSAIRETDWNFHKKYGWTHFLIGPSPAPRAWDYLFRQNDLVGWVRLKTKSGLFKAGIFIEGSYVAGYPEPQDIYLSYTVEADPESGVLLEDAEGEPILHSGGLLIRWDEVEYLELGRW